MWEFVLSFLASLGGATFIIAGFTHWLGKVWAGRLIQKEKAKLDLEIENYRVKLKKSEFIFQKQYDAASELVALNQSIIPKQHIPNMIWDEVCEDIAHSFSEIEVRLRNYLGTHGAILTEIAADNIQECMRLAGTAQYYVTFNNVSKNALKAANELYEKLKEAEKSLIKQVLDQSST